MMIMMPGGLSLSSSTYVCYHVTTEATDDRVLMLCLFSMLQDE